MGTVNEEKASLHLFTSSPVQDIVEETRAPISLEGSEDDDSVIAI